jgi:hypothetical protein
MPSSRSFYFAAGYRRVCGLSSVHCTRDACVLPHLPRAKPKGAQPQMFLQNVSANVSANVSE